MMKENMENKEMEQKEEKKVTNEQLYEEIQIMRKGIAVLLNNQAFILNRIAKEESEKENTRESIAAVSGVDLTFTMRDLVDPKKQEKVKESAEEGIKEVLKMLFSDIDK